jgi:hypothetical protein
MRGVIITHSDKERPVKGFNMYTDAKEWVENSGFDSDKLTITSVKLH